jgi:hypothetical protein
MTLQRNRVCPRQSTKSLPAVPAQDEAVVLFERSRARGDFQDAIHLWSLQEEPVLQTLSSRHEFERLLRNVKAEPTGTP